MRFLNLFIAQVCLIKFAILLVVVSGQSTINTISSEIFLEGELVMPTALAYVDGWLFVKDDFQSNPIIAYDVESGEKMIEFGRSGRGPGEYLNFTIQKGPGLSTLEVVDLGNQKIDIYDVECLKNLFPPSRTSTCINNTYSVPSRRHAMILTDSLIVTHSFTQYGVLQVRKNGNISEYLDSIPTDLINRYNNPMQATLTMTGRLTANADRTHFAYFADSFDRAIFFKRNGMEVFEINKKPYTFLPDFEVLSYGGSSILKEGLEYIYTYGSPDAGSKNYYVLYSGKSSSDTELNSDAEWRAFTKRVLVYNWNGVQEREFFLDKEVFIISVSHYEQIIYGIHFDRDMTPSIIKANL